MNKQTVRDIDVGGKKVLLRVDFNVPIENGKITDDTRMIYALPTIRYLLENKAAVLIMTHLGRPKGKVVPELSVRPLVKHLSSLLGQEVLFAGDCGGDESARVSSEIKPGQVALLENTRFYPGEEKNDPEMARKLAGLADIYVNDAFGAAHRAHASTEGVARYLPAVAGFLLEKELNVLSGIVNNAERPFIVVLGGAKISDKLPVIKRLLDRVDAMLVGGGLANTLLKASGKETGKSLVEEDKLAEAGSILREAAEAGKEMLLPGDVVVADRFSAGAQARVVQAGSIPADWMVLDIGPETVKTYARAIGQAKTVFWNGPLGVYEFERFACGTNEIAKAVAEAKAKTVIGGGDVVAAVEKTGLADRIYHISTGGGASLEFLEGRTLPGVAVLQEK
ncbi:MAG: phosphoglycerate kinase [Peptococcaceae bacterium]|jgi:phosphoglycerate kinase|nr:phosphoglycerate kinase [Peptococcaceae bacterium]MDH7524748.1 phosphoglycerate kinase [Peptococcaceae bacterium]